MPFTSIERAFAIPLDDENPSWFFRFASSSNGAEYIIEVLNGKVVGTNETELPEYIEPPLDELRPLGDEWTVMDNTVVLRRYVDQEDSLLSQSPHMLIAYRLAKMIEQSHPVWTLFNARNLTNPVFKIDAVTGESLPIE